MPLSNGGNIDVPPPADTIGEAVSQFFTDHCVINVDKRYRDTILNLLWMTAQATSTSTTPQTRMMQFCFQHLELERERYVLHSPGVIAGALQWMFFNRKDVITLNPGSPLLKGAVGMEGMYILTVAPQLLTFGNNVVWQAQD
jgi:hypothetical protein